jgi:LysR family nitrogen assimilation transcriptional regulator
MELRQLRYFVGVSEAGSLLKASTRLHLAQPALGQQIAQLEQSLGVRLFERSSRGVRLTPAGEVFLEHARIVLADSERARQAVRDTAAVPSGDVAVGLPTTVSLALTVPLVATCRRELPQVRLQVVEAYSGHLREWLLAGRLDLALLFGAQRDKALAQRPWLEERLALVTSAQDGPAPQRQTLRQAAGRPLVLPGLAHDLRRIIDDAAASQGLAFQVVAEIDSLPSVKKAVEAGLGATILPVAAVADEVKAGRLQAVALADASMKRQVVCASSVTRPASPASVAVQALATRLAREMVRSQAWPARWVGETEG